jgi:hypothetical protein
MRSNLRQLAIIARYTLLEALRARVIHVLAAGLALATLGALFAAELAITESARLRAVLLATTVRSGVVLLVAVHVISTLARELSERSCDTLLALDLPRATWLAGRLGGYALLAVLAAAAAFVPLALLAPVPAALVWSASLALETTLVAAAALFFLVTFAHPAAAAVFVAGFYLLARSIDALLLIAAAPLGAAHGALHALADATLHALAWLLPALARVTQSAWLVDGLPAASTLALLAAQGLVYCVLLAAAASYDLRRKEL